MYYFTNPLIKLDYWLIEIGRLKTEPKFVCLTLLLFLKDI